MTGYQSKRAAAQDKLDDDDTLTIAYQSGFYDGKKAAQRPCVGLTKEAIAEFGTWYDNREEEVGWVSPAEIVAYIDDKLRSKNT